MRRAAFTGVAASVPFIAAACTDDGEEVGAAAANGAVGNFPETPEFNFVFVNHVTTNPFFVPTQFGIEDASEIFRTKFQWTGSETSDVSEMVDAFNTARAAGADGIAVSIVDPTAFNDPIEQALGDGIPVISYNADGKGIGTTPRLAYVGQDLFQSGVEMGKRIVELVGEGSVVLFIATPGQLNIQPRIDGAAQAIRDSGAPIEFAEIATGAELPEELAKIESYFQGHQDIKGMFAVDAGSTQGVAQTIEKFDLAAEGVKGGGYDLLPKTLELMKEGHLDFTIDQQPYLQGFYPVVQMYLWKLSGGLSGPAETNTGLLFVTPETVDQYLQTSSRYEGDAEDQKILEPIGR